MYNFKKLYILNKSLFAHLNEAKNLSEPDSKDIKRIEDIIKKAPNNTNLQEALAKRMVKSITDTNKMWRRYKAAVSVLGLSHPVSIIFHNGCINMGIDTNQKTVDIVDDITSTADSVQDAEIEHIELNPSDIQKALDKQKNENELNSITNDITNIDSEDEIHNLPFEYIKKILNVKQYFNNELSKYRVADIINDELHELLKTKSRYNISSINVTEFSLHLGTLTINVEVVYQVKPHGYDRQYYGGDACNANIVMKNIRYSILNHEWDLEGFNTSITWDSYKLNTFNISARDKSAAFIKFLGNCIDKCIKKYPKINNLILLYSHTVYRIYKSNSRLFSSIDTPFSAGDKENLKFSPVNQLRERIIDMICTKYNVDDESDWQWPGFKLISIHPGSLKFTIYPYREINRSAYHGNKSVHNMANEITGMTTLQEIQTLYNFFVNTIKIPKEHIFMKKPDTQSARSLGYIEITTSELAAALKD